MASNNVTAKGGSIGVGGDNNGDILNISAEKNAVVNVNVQRAVERRLPSLLGKLIVVFAEERLSDYADQRPQEVPPEVDEKLKFNDISDHRLVREYIKYVAVLEKAYKGAEQRNSDARVLVRRKAGVAYTDILDSHCTAESIPTEQRKAYARKHSASLVAQVIDALLKGYGASASGEIEEEIAHLAVSLVVAEAIFDCEVLERPTNAAAA